MNPLDFLFQFSAVFVGAIIALTLGRALAARIAGPHAGLVLSGPIIAINIALPHSREREEDQDNEIDTGNTETAGNTEETQGNTKETALSAPSDYMTVTDNSGSRSVRRFTREEYHELVEIRVKTIDLLQKCLDYYRESGETDDGKIPRWNKIHMQSEDRGRYVDALWDSGYVLKSSKGTLIDPAYFPTCEALMLAIKENRVTVYPYGWAERMKQKHLEAAMALPGNDRE